MSVAIKKNFVQTEVDYIFFFFWGETNIEAISFSLSERVGFGLPALYEKGKQIRTRSKY